MQSKKAASSSRYDYTVLLDVVALIGILVIAGRPDGLAITLGAIVVSLAAVVYRCTVGVKAWMDRRGQAAEEEVDLAFRRPTREAPPAIPPLPASRSKSWLRDAD